MSKEHIVILLRHGESEWNKDNRFCGWVDVGLSDIGLKEAEKAAEAIHDCGIDVTKIFTSVLKRANQTVDLILEKIDVSEDRIQRDWRLNERHYGSLTGLNKADCVQEYGSDQVQIWRRSYDIPPPPMESSHPYYDEIIRNLVYKDVLNEEDIPDTESLKDLIEKRTVPFWKSVVEPQILAGETVLCVAHGTSLRGIVKHIERLSDDEITKLDLPNGIPIVYRLDNNLEMLVSKEYLADAESVEEALKKVSNIMPKK